MAAVRLTLKLIGFVILLLLVLIVLAAGLRHVPIHVHDGFESSHLSWRWSHAKLVRGAAMHERSIVRSGHSALAITVHSGDKYEAASDDGLANERAELLESRWLWSRSGLTYVYSFSLFLPSGFEQSSERLVLAQWKQDCETEPCRPDNPVLALRYENGLLIVTREDASGHRIVLYQGSEDVRGRWLDFRFVTRFDGTKQGSIDATLNGHSIVRYQGATLYPPGHGYPSHSRIYFKMGLYRDALNQPPWTIYVDEYGKDQCSNKDCR